MQLYLKRIKNYQNYFSLILMDMNIGYAITVLLILSCINKILNERSVLSGNSVKKKNTQLNV